MMTLETIKQLFEDDGFDTSLNDGVVEASKEFGEISTEITIDNGGGCKVVKKKIINNDKIEIRLVDQNVPVVHNLVDSKIFRIQIDSEEKLKTLLYSISNL